MGFWQNVNDEMKYKNVSRKELAFLSGVPQTTIDKGIERDSEVSAITGIKVAKALNVSLEVLLNLEFVDRSKSFAKNKDFNNEEYSKFIESFDKLPKSTKKIFEELVFNIQKEITKK